MNCFQCGAEGKDADAFCSQCGARMPKFDFEYAANVMGTEPRAKKRDSVKGFFISIAGQLLHLAAAYGPPLLAVYLLDRNGKAGAIVPFVPLIIMWVFGVHYATRRWINWGDRRR